MNRRYLVLDRLRRPEPFKWRITQLLATCQDLFQLQCFVFNDSRCFFVNKHNEVFALIWTVLGTGLPSRKKIKTDFPGKSTFFESPITQKRFIFEESYISYGKRQKSCTLIVILVIWSYLTSPIFNSSSKSTGFFFGKRGSSSYNFFKCSH